ncbi:MAG: recombination-associated protein RdgC [Chromatiales bacterium]|nr:recombination-associated protein RdgC [Chromatiales bacterium]MCK7581169.1 recombination-associated protein RdgC [Chromatiales bacterium]
MFKNARLFRLVEPFATDPDALQSMLEARRFRPCNPLEVSALGWVPPMGEDTEALVHSAAGCLLMCTRYQERILPSAAVKEAVEARVAEIETQEAREVGRAERRRLREQLATELLPHALTRSRRLQIYIDTMTGWLVVDAASAKQAEDVVSLLRLSLGSLRAVPPDAASMPAEVMRLWLLDEPPEPFTVLDACELRSPDASERVRCAAMNLSSDEVRGHLEAGKWVSKLALDWDARFGFVLAEDLSLKRLAMREALLATMAEDFEDARARLDAEFVLFAGQLRELIAHLVKLFAIARVGGLAA